MRRLLQPLTSPLGRVRSTPLPSITKYGLGYGPRSVQLYGALQNKDFSTCMAERVANPAVRHRRSKLARTSSTASSTKTDGLTAGGVVVFFMALLPSRIRHPEPTGSRRATPLSLFQQWPGHPRGLCARRIYNAWRIADRFLDHRFGNGDFDLGKISPRDVSAFLERLAGFGGRFRNRTATSLLRLFLQYLFTSGATQTNLALCVPKVVRRRYASVPRYLPADQIEKVLDAVRSHPRHGLRGYAMILLMARLGLRAPEVIAIQLDDIDWRAGELLVRGKGGLHDRLPLPPDVGEALARYVRDERVTASRALFVTRHAANSPFKDGQIINAILREAFVASGVKPSGRYIGSYVLRHSLATNLVRNGASLEEVGDVLRHRSRATTMIYAKVDMDGLRSVAQPWPVTGGVQ